MKSRILYATGRRLALAVVAGSMIALAGASVPAGSEEGFGPVKAIKVDPKKAALGKRRSVKKRVKAS